MEPGQLFTHLPYYKLYTKSGGGIIIGANSTIGRKRNSRSIIGHFYPTKIYVKNYSALVKIGDNTNLNGVYIACRKSITIGDNCRLASGVVILDYYGHELHSQNRTTGIDCPKSIIIGNNVWIGTNSIILKDTTIGDNCVVSCGSIVKGHFDKNSIIQGNPGVVVGKINI